MPGHTIGSYAGNVSGYQAVGDEVRADAGSPRAAAGGSVGASIGGQFADVRPLGQPPRADQDKQEKPERPADEDQGDGDSWRYTATVEAPGPSFGGAAWTNGGPLADAITSGDRGPAIEPAAPKVIAGIAEDVL
jgi:hypothetical protein